MKVNDIVKTTATLLAREDVVNYITKPNGTGYTTSLLETVDVLTRLANMVILELAEGLIMMVDEVNANGKSSINFATLGISPLEILAVYDNEGNELDYVKNAYGLESKGGVAIYKIAYSYLPENYGLTDTIGKFMKPVSYNLLAYGVAAEFCLTQARFEEALMWNDRFVKGVNALMRPKNGRVKGRSFI